MIVVDTSALIAVLLQEKGAKACHAILLENEIVISAATLTEALIVAQCRNRAQELTRMVDDLTFEIVPLTAPASYRAARAYARWGKGNHPANLNYGDCFAYELAIDRACPLLFIGKDFAKTDVKSAL
jgi:ribonuclease VapC